MTRFLGRMTFKTFPCWPAWGPWMTCTRSPRKMFQRLVSSLGSFHFRLPFISFLPRTLPHLVKSKEEFIVSQCDKSTTPSPSPPPTEKAFVD
eukprot:scaffold1193_cov159-Ochromonas_danica.AAC.20